MREEYVEAGNTHNVGSAKNVAKNDGQEVEVKLVPRVELQREGSARASQLSADTVD